MFSLGPYGSGQTDHEEKYYHSTCLATTDCTCHLQMQHNNIRFSKTTAVLGLAHSAVNWQEVERDVAVNWCQRFELRVWPRHKDCLLMTYRRTITPSSSIAPSMLRTLIISDFLPPKTKSELKEMRNDSLFFHATVSYHPRN